MSILNIGLSGLTASQIALSVTAQNTANVNVDGYSRQEAQLASRYSNSFGPLDAGMGVGVTGLRRVADDYLTAQLWRVTSQQSYHEGFNQYIGQAEQLVSSDSLNISLGMDAFFASLDAASEQPQSIAPRQQVVSSAGALARRFNQLASSLQLQGTQLTGQIDASLSQINTYTRQIADLNAKIADLTARSGNTSQLEDQRDNAIKNLSKLTEVQVSRQADSTVTVSLGQGQPLVLGSVAAKMSRIDSDLSVDLAGQKFPISGNVGGTLGGLLDYRDDVLKPAQQTLDQIATQLADDFNTQLAAGTDINDPRGTGKPLFTYDPSNPAGSLAITAGYQPEDLAFGSAAAGVGDNSNLLALLAQKDGNYDAYTSLVGSLAIRSAQAQSELDASAQLVTEVQAKRDGVSGVNLEEENANMLKYLQSYQANAKVISTADQLFTTLLQMF